MEGGSGATAGSGSGGPDGGSGGTTTADSGGENGGTGGTTSASCPSVEPAAFTSCSIEQESCTYINCMAPDYRNDHVMLCVNGTWTLASEEQCEVDPEACPATTPRAGQSCDSEATPGPCSSVDACGSIRAAYCTDGVWSYDAARIERLVPATGDVGTVGTASSTSGGTRPEPECPIDPPVLGAACCPANYPALCDYGAGTGGSSGFGAPVPAAGGAGGVGSSTVGGFGDVGTASASGGAFGTGGSGATGGPSTSDCVTCSANMVWEASSECL